MGKKQTRYFGGWEINVDDEEEFSLFLSTHGVDKKGFDFFKKAQSGLEFKINDEIATKIIKYDYDGKEVVAEGVELPMTDWVDHEVFFLTKDTTGRHRIGGRRPSEYNLPTFDGLKTTFQYLGTIDGNDSLFSWMGLGQLHIAFPIYECNFGVYLDCSDELHPIIMNPETFSDAWYSSDMGEVGEIEFKETNYKVTDEIEIEEFVDSDDILLCGVPLWYQAPAVPRCPKSGMIMRFVCTLNSDSDLEVINKEDSANLPFSDECLCFGDWGHLFVFYSPETKVMYMNIQF